ncbi:MAG: penicillin-binding protein 1C [Bacteroidales bacterium]|nr:penicillin-binding protein 1C [Bacteroidales bacterium]MDD4213984.1 penicillin-binding protein 1C [Bacteroidales bacterium]
MIRYLKKKWWILLLICFAVSFWFSLPEPLFREPTSTVMEDKYGNLMCARIASDGQWRFPQNSDVPDKFSKSLILFEDRYFYLHNGLNPVAMFKAVIRNIRSGKVVSGGSTITMQIIRLSRKGQARTIKEKIIETFLAVRLELTYSKKEIMGLYAANAPFGGNVVGLDAASWRYFGKKSVQLSWAEAATLAVLPNSPSLVFPGKNREKLKEKRDKLLRRLYDNKDITEDEFVLARHEPLPGKPYPLPQRSIHLLDRAIKENWMGKRIKTTLDGNIQAVVNSIVERYHKKYQANNVQNAAVLILETETGHVLAYVGNTNEPQHPEYGCQVDLITAPRSTGSILKPFLYAAMLNDGQLLPASLVADIPIQLGSFIPENYNYTYDGAVPAKKALSRSLNVPAVKMLQAYGTVRFNNMLKKVGLTTLQKPPSHYGLAIILGGAEANLWDLAGAYASMARTLNHYQAYNSMYSKDDFHSASYLYKETAKKTHGTDNSSVLSASSIWFTFEAMNEVSRPDEDAGWQEFSSSAKIAWKTGTSYGSRDAWAIGCNPKYVVAVLVGNSGGEGRPGMTGLTYAAPIMFEAFKLLKPQGWFYAPYDDMIQLSVCRKSGFKATQLCEEADTVWVQKKGEQTKNCPYHQLVLTDATGKWRVNSDCEALSNMVYKNWFVLPPVMEYFYKSKNPFYKTLPPYREDCLPAESSNEAIDMIYPKNNTRVYIPVDLNGERQKVVFKAAHSNAAIKIYWYLDKIFIGVTSDFHNVGLAPEAGKHSLTLVDEKGQSLSVNFEVIDKK